MPPAQFICSKADCTFSVTGTCLESIENPMQKCPNLRQAEPDVGPEAGTPDTAERERDDQPARLFPSGLEIGLHDASSLMRSRYTRLVGVLGQSNAGKTCLFTSLYLRLSNRCLLPRFRFAGSLTLQGFEHRARHLRDWTRGDIPDQIADRTSLGDSRSPAFLHIAIQEEGIARHDLLVPDLPGEWTTQLLSDATTAYRFAFLQRSDIICVALEAPLFAARQTRHNALTDARQLITRLADDVRVPTEIPVALVVTKCDETGGQAPAEINQIATEVSKRGYKVTVLPAAAFPGKAATVQPGFGIDRLVEHMTLSRPLVTRHPSQDGAVTDRSYLSARGHV